MHSSFIKIVDIMQQERLTLREAEFEVNGITHEEVASILLEKWNFPNEIIEPILYHHIPSQSNSSPTMSSIINLADFMTEALKIGELYLDRGIKLDELTLNKFKFEKELDAEKFSSNYKDLFWEQMEFVRFLS
jgi:HD-like signal output (HDOD) protein